MVACREKVVALRLSSRHGYYSLRILAVVLSLSVSLYASEQIRVTPDLTVHPPFELVQLGRWQDGTLGFNVVDNGNRKLNFCLEPRDGSSASGRWYLGGMHFSHPGTTTVEKGTDTERALIRVLEVWVSQHFSEKEQEWMRNMPWSEELKHYPVDYNAWTILRLLGNRKTAMTMMSGIPEDWDWHTHPDKWKEPRRFHMPFDERYESRVRISLADLGSPAGTRVFSPNRAYWFALESARREGNSHFHVSSSDAAVHVFNERDRLIRIKLIKRDPDLPLEIDWINEKLLYVEVWWSGALGSSLIYDVERESILLREMVNDGKVPYQNFKMKGK